MVQRSDKHKPMVVPVTGLVLAGGMSSRMGRNKALLRWQHQLLLQHMGDLLLQAGLNKVFVSGPDDLAQSCAINFPLVQDSFPHRGPLSGIHACLKKIISPESGLLIIPVDMPLLTPDIIERLATEGQMQQRPLHFEGFNLPLYLPASPAVMDFVDTVIRSTNRRDYSLYRTVRQFDGRVLSLDGADPDCFRNANTPSEWQSCLSLADI